MNAGEMKQRAEELGDQLLELAKVVDGLLSGEAMDVKQDQLIVICASIRQLEERAVPVPDELRRIKLDLTGSLAVVEEIKAILRKKLLDAFDLLNIPTVSNGGAPSANRKRVALSDLLDSGVLRDGMQVVHRAGRTGQEHHGYIRSPGVIEVTVKGKQQRFGSPSAAGVATSGRTTDGWGYWSVVGDNGDDVLLKIYRDRFLKRANV